MKKLRSLLALVLVVAMISSFAIISASATPATTMSFYDLAVLIESKVENAAGDSITIKLDKDVAVSQEDINSSYALVGYTFDIVDYNNPTQVTNFTIDLNGHNIYLNYDDENYINGFGIGSTDGNGISISSNVTFTDSSNNPGTIYLSIDEDPYSSNPSDNYHSIFRVIENSSLTIENIKVVASEYADIINCWYGSVIINSGDFTLENGCVFRSGYYNNQPSPSTITINDGSFKAVGTEVNYPYIAESYNTTYTINGGTFSGFEGGIYAGGCNITINNAEITTKYNPCVAVFDSIYNTSSVSTINYSSLVINNGTFTNDGSSNGTSSYCDTLDIYGGNVEINDGKFTSSKGSALYIYPDNNFSDTAKVEINDGEFISSNKSTIYLYYADDYPVSIKNATITFNNSNYSNARAKTGAILIDGGDLTVDKCNISSNSFLCDGIYQLDGALKISDTNVTTSSSPALFYRAGTLNISSGTFDGLVGLSISCDSDEDETPDITLSGGRFKAADDIPEAYKAELPEESWDELRKELCGIVCTKSDLDLMSILDTGYSYYSADGKDKDAFSKITVEIPGETEFELVGTSKVVEVEKTYTTILESKNVKNDAVMLDGIEAKIDASTATKATFRSNVDFKWFNDGEKQIGEVKVDGKTVDPTNYVAEAGSTKITFTEAYLKTLANGEHTIQIISNILGNKIAAETTFTVTNHPEETEEVAQTGDNNMVGAFVALGMFSALGYTALKKKEN